MVVRYRRQLLAVATVALVTTLGFVVLAQQTPYPASLLAGLHWRDVGPMRGGRCYGVAGNANQPDTFYFGSVGGGVWKTENAGRTWFPISDEGIPIGSIGAIAVAPSNPNIVYVGTGEPDIRSQHSYGIGMYQIHRRGQDLDAHRPRSHATDRTRRGRPGESESRLRGGARPRLRSQSGARRLSLDRRRHDLEEDSVQAERSRQCRRRSMSPSIRRIRACSTLRCGRRAVRHGRFTRPPTCPAADCTNPPTAATPGSN